MDEGDAIRAQGSADDDGHRGAIQRAAIPAAAVLVTLAGLVGSPDGLAQQWRPPQPSREDEIAPFRLTGMEGYVLMKYLRDDNLSSQSASGSSPGYESRQTLTDLRAEVFLMTHSYVYHPSFLLLDLGGGPVIDQSGYATEGGSTRSSKPLYNLSCRATFLKDKPYRGSVFYEHLNPTQSVGLAQIMLSENTRYGAEALWVPTKQPYSANANASRSHTKGRSAEQTMDDSIDELNVRAEWRFGRLGDSQFRYQSSRQDSRSGSVALPIQSTQSDTDNLSLDTRLNFGAANEYDLYNSITYYANSYADSEGRTIADTRDARFSLDLRGNPTRELQTFARYNFARRETGDQTISLNTVDGGATYQATPDLSATLGARGDYNSTTQLRATTFGFNGSVTYFRDLPLGRASASYAFNYFGNDQNATEAQALVEGERVTLPGTALVPLSRPLVVPGSVTVSNVGRTQTFVEGADYLLSVLGLVTRIQRVVGGNITDGQEVLVDYTYDVGGTYNLRQADNSLNLGWTYDRYVSVYVRFLDSSPTLLSGTPSSPLNPVRSTLYGARADVPVPWLLDDLMVGGYAEREDRRETISPYTRTAGEAYVQAETPLIGRGTIRLGTRQTVIDYDYDPLQGVNLRSLDFRYSTRIFGGLEISIDASRERDTGTPVVRERRYTGGRAQWRIRQFLMTFDLTRTRDVQGPTQRDRTYALLALRRDF